MPAEKCKAGQGMAVGKHTFSLTLVVVTECAFCMHSWMNVVMTAFTAEFIAVLRGSGMLLFFWDWPKRKTDLLFQTNAVTHVLSQRFIDNQKPEKPPLVCPLIDMFAQFLANVYQFFKSPAWEGPQPPQLSVQQLRNSTVRTVFPLLSSPNLAVIWA